MKLDKTQVGTMNCSLENAKAVILIGDRDFGRCPLASRVNRALWPVGEKSVLQRLIEHIAGQGISKFVLCCEDDIEALRGALDIDGSWDVRFISEMLPRGTAGCIRDAGRPGSDELLVVFHAAILAPPDIGMMVDAHHKAGADMTIMFNPSTDNGLTHEPAQIYICQSSILEHIPKAGYCDIKEGLVADLVRVGKTIRAVELVESVGNFRCRREYLWAVSAFMQRIAARGIASREYANAASAEVWLGSGAQVDSTARFFGQVLVCENANVSADAVILGPTIIGRNAVVGKGSLLAQSVLWDNARIGANCEVQQCLLSYDAAVASGKKATEKLVSAEHVWLNRAVEELVQPLSNACVQTLKRLKHKVNSLQKKLPNWAFEEKLRGQAFAWLGGVILLLILLWTYWRPTIVELWQIWLQSDEYSSGILVPLIAAYVIWSRRRTIAESPIRPCMWAVAALIAVQGLRFFGLYFMYASAERLSLVLTIGALVLFLFGWRLFARVSPILLFTLLMLPLPNRVQSAVTIPLQKWAASSAVFCLETLGYGVIREGNIIDINGTQVAVAEACNGLRMLTAFFVVSGLVALLVQRRWWEKLIILGSSIPVALLCNTLRLTVTAIAFTKINAKSWESTFHDFGGLAMMPLALAMIVLELWLLSRLMVEPAQSTEQVYYKTPAG